VYLTLTSNRLRVETVASYRYNGVPANEITINDDGDADAEERLTNSRLNSFHSKNLLERVLL
jgi:hypothetical protein